MSTQRQWNVHSADLKRPQRGWPKETWGRPEMLPPITRARRDESLPLSFAQLRLWLLAQTERARQTYHVPFGLLLKGDLDAPALRRALDRIVARHEALRTSFICADG